MKLTIIIPVYNVEKYLAKCLDSVIEPELKDYEIVLVNDGSTDRSPEIAEQYQKKYPELIKVISQENGGLGAARNTGIEAAAGEYLVCVDSDDTLVSGAVAQMLERIREGFDLCLFGMVSVNENGKEVNDLPLCSREGVFSLRDYPELLLSSPSACNKIYARRLFMDTGIRFPGRVWYEDIRTIPKLYLHCSRVVTDKRAWYRYLQREGSIIHTGNAARNTQIIDAIDDVSDYYKAQGMYEQYREELEYLAFYNQFLTASVRVCLIDPRHPAVQTLREDFIRKYPAYKNNRYIKQMPLKHRLLSFLLMHGQRYAVRFIMLINNLAKSKAP